MSWSTSASLRFQLWHCGYLVIFSVVMLLSGWLNLVLCMWGASYASHCFGLHPFFWKEPLVSLWSDSNKQTNTQVNSEENLFKCSKSRKSVNRTLEIIYPSFEMNGKRSTCHCGVFNSCCKEKEVQKLYMQHS